MKDLKSVFVSYKESFEFQNKLLKISFLVIFSVLIATLFLINANRTRFFYLESNYLKKELPIKDVCYLTITTIADKSLNKFIISQKLVDYFSGSKKHIISPDKIFEPVLLNNNKCKVMVLEKGKIRSFILNYKPTPGVGYEYIIYDINETVTDPKENT